MPSSTPLVEDASREAATAGEEPIHHYVQVQHNPHVITSPFVENNEDSADSRSIALVILNAPIPKKQRSGGGNTGNVPTGSGTVFDRLWDTSSYRVCADGGANRLYVARCIGDESGITTTTSSSRNHDDYVPDLIVGDLDSLHVTVRRHFENRGCAIRRVYDQDRNDLDKAMDAVRDEHERRRRRKAQNTLHPPPAFFRHVVVYGAFGGRFDQEMASLQALYKWSDAFGGTTTTTNVWLYDENTCACLLQPNNVRNVVTVCPDVENVRSVGLIPLGSRCDRVFTTGFRWNLNGDAMEFGGLVSTSNEMTEPTVTIQASHRLVFTAAVQSGVTNEWMDPILVDSDKVTSEPQNAPGI